MGQYKKKPVVIEATQIQESDFTDDHPNPDHVNGVWYHNVDRYCEIETLEGTMRGHVGDWIITGVQGEKYFCKPDIFDATYERSANQ